MTTEQKAKAEQYFKDYPEARVIHETSDGQVFLGEKYNDAVNHQALLTKTNNAARLTTYDRKQVEAPEVEKEEGDDAAVEEFKKLVPDENMTKQDIVRWLNLYGEEANVNDKKDKLLEQVAAVLKKQDEEEEEEEEAGQE